MSHSSFSMVQWSVEKDDAIMGKVAKGKGKPPWQKWKKRKMCLEARQRIDSQFSKLQFEAVVYDFVSWLVLE